MNSDADDAPTPGITERIRACARIAGSGDELARLAGIGRRTLENYLAGRREPKASTVWAIASAVGVSADWLLGGIGPMQPDQEPAPVDDRPAIESPPPADDPKFKLACKLGGTLLTMLRKGKLLTDCDEEDFSELLLGLIEIVTADGMPGDDFKPNADAYLRLMRALTKT